MDFTDQLPNQERGLEWVTPGNTGRHLDRIDPTKGWLCRINRCNPRWTHASFWILL